MQHTNFPIPLHHVIINSHAAAVFTNLLNRAMRLKQDTVYVVIWTCQNISSAREERGSLRTAIPAKCISSHLCCFCTRNHVFLSDTFDVETRKKEC